MHTGSSSVNGMNIELKTNHASIFFKPYKTNKLDTVLKETVFESIFIFCSTNVGIKILRFLKIKKYSIKATFIGHVVATVIYCQHYSRAYFCCIIKNRIFLFSTIMTGQIYRKYKLSFFTVNIKYRIFSVYSVPSHNMCTLSFNISLGENHRHKK